MQPADFLIERADLIATCAGPAPRRGHAQRDISPLRQGVVAARGQRITFVGPAAELRNHVDVLPETVRVDAAGCTVVPGFVDAHTHIVYAGNRLDEVHRRLAGASYADIAAQGGGIARTVRATRDASDDELVASARVRLDEMIAAGTTTCEAKSGYGLALEPELRQLQVIRRLDAEHAVDVVATFLGAHVVPDEHRSRPDDYVAQITNEMIPRVAEASLAEWCDVFCDVGAFTSAQSEAILAAGAQAGLKPRIHADEFSASGGALVAARVGARSADHLIHLDKAGAATLAGAGVCATLLPIAALYLKLGRYAPARLMIDEGVPVALGTDFNPGAGLSPSMPFAMALACFGMNLTVEEALVAATLNAAWSLDRSDSVGSLETGKLMDAVVVRGDLTNLLRVGTPSIQTVIKRGKVLS